MEDYKKIIYKEYYSKRSEKKLPSSAEDLKGKRPFYENVIRQYFPKDKKVRIIDIGCGYGAFVSLMKEFGYHSTSGIDVSSEMIDWDKMTSAHFECSTQLSLPSKPDLDLRAVHTHTHTYLALTRQLDLLLRAVCHRPA